MFQKILIFLLFGNYFIFQVAGNYVNVACKTTQPITTEGIHANDFIYFSSPPNFPTTISNLTYSYPCGIRIAAVEDGNRIWFAMLNGEVSQIILGDNNIKQTIPYYNSNSDIVTKLTSSGALDFTIPENSSPQLWTAFQAVAIAYDPKLNLACPFASQIFDFSVNPQLIIPIASEFAPNSTYVSKACNWAFKLKSDQQLKFVIKNFNPSQNYILTLNADGKVLKTFNNSAYYAPKVDYYNGTNFNLTFTDQWSSNSSVSSFFILISAVSETNTFNQKGCKNPAVDGNFTTFSNMDYINGYPKNQECNNTIYIPTNSEAALYVNEFHIEMSVDTLTITDNKNQPFNLGQTSALFYYSLTQAANGAVMSFKSDGNIQEAGYTAVMKTYECKCNAKNLYLPCDSPSTIIPLMNSSMYCDKMKCNYTIVPNTKCPNAYITITVNPFLRYGDYLLLKDNGNILKNFTSAPQLNYPYYFSSKSKITFEFTSGASISTVNFGYKQWYVSTSNTSAPNFTKFNLNDSSPSNIIWLDTMKTNDAITVCSDDKNLEIFVTTSAFNSLENYILYDGDDLYSNIGSLDSKFLTSPSNTIPRQKTSSSGCFTIYKASESSLNVETTVLFRKGKTNANNCNEIYTVYQPSIYGDNFNASSRNSGPCEMIILIGSTDKVPKIWFTINETTPNSIYAFTDLTTNKKLFDLDSSKTSVWKNFGIYSTALSITLPPSSMISLMAKDSYSQFIQINSLPQNGIMTSPRYSNSAINNMLLYTFEQYSSDDEMTANFMVKSITGSPTINLQMDNTQQSLSTNSNITITSRNFMIYYSSNDLEKDSFLIEYALKKATPETSGSNMNGYGIAIFLTVILSLKLF